MRAYIQNMSELTDSRELLESRPQPIIGVFTYTLVILLAFAVLWSYFGEIDVTVKARGIVRPNQKISSIRNQVSGKVESMNLKEGAYVKRGEVLFTMEHTVLDLQKQALSAEYDKTVRDLEYLELFKKSILENKNYFSSILEEEREYYNKFEKYRTDLEVQSKQVELNSSSMNDVQKELAELNTLKQSVLQEKNLFSGKDSTYGNQYIDYSLNVKNLKALLNQKKELSDSFEELAAAGAISSKELENAEEEVAMAEINLQKYQNEFLLNINAKIDENQEKLEQLRINLKTAGGKQDASSIANELTLEKYKMDTIVQTETDIKSLQTALKKLSNELATTDANIKHCTIVSPIDGYVSISTEINTGDLLQSGTEAATIVPEADSAYKVQLYVSNADIANIKTGDKIKYHFLALPYREYGELTGNIVSIGTDARVNQADGSSYYSVEASVENKPLLSYKGARSEIKVGMECEAQVVTKTKKILYYLLEKINLMD